MAINIRTEGLSAGQSTPTQSPRVDPARFGAAQGAMLQDTADLMAGQLKTFQDKKDAEDMVYFESRLTRDMAQYSSELEAVDDNGAPVHPDFNKPRAELYRTKATKLVQQYQAERGMTPRLQKRFYDEVIPRTETTGFNLDARRNAEKSVLQARVASDQLYNNTLFSLEGAESLPDALTLVNEGLDQQNILVASAKASNNAPLYNFQVSKRDSLAVRSALKLARYPGGRKQAEALIKRAGVDAESYEKYQDGMAQLSKLAATSVSAPINELMSNLISATPEAIASAEDNLKSQIGEGFLASSDRREAERKLSLIKAVSSAPSKEEAIKRAQAARVLVKDDPSLRTQFQAFESSLNSMDEGEYSARRNNGDLFLVAQRKGEGVTGFSVNGVVDVNAVARDVGDFIKAADKRADKNLSYEQRKSQVAYPLSGYVASVSERAENPMQFADALSGLYQGAEIEAGGTEVATKAILGAYKMNEQGMKKYGNSLLPLILINQQTMSPDIVEFSSYLTSQSQQAKDIQYPNPAHVRRILGMEYSDKARNADPISQEDVVKAIKGKLLNNEVLKGVTQGYNFQRAMTSDSSLYNDLLNDWATTYAVLLSKGEIKDEGKLKTLISDHAKRMFPTVFIDGIPVHQAMTPRIMTPSLEGVPSDLSYAVSDIPWLGGNRERYLKDQLMDSFRNELELSTSRNWTGVTANYAARIRDSYPAFTRALWSGFARDNYGSLDAATAIQTNSIDLGAGGVLNSLGDFGSRNSNLVARELRSKLEKGDVFLQSVAYNKGNGKPLFLDEDVSKWPQEVVRGVKNILKADEEGARSFNLDTLVGAFKQGNVFFTKAGTTVDGKSIVSVSLKNIEQLGGRTIPLVSRDGTPYTFVLDDAVASTVTYNSATTSDHVVSFMQKKYNDLNLQYQKVRQLNEESRLRMSRGGSGNGR